MSSPEETGPERAAGAESAADSEGAHGPDGTLDSQRAPGGSGIDLFRGEPTRDPAAWRWLWEEDRWLPVESHRPGLLGRLVVRFKRWLRPLVKAPVADLWDRQRAFNLVVLGLLDEQRADLTELGRDLQSVRDDLLRDLKQIRGDLLRDVRNNHRRITHLEGFKREGFDDVMRHNDALYAVVDQKLDRYRRRSRELWSRLGGLLALAEGGGGVPEDASLERLASSWRDQGYLALENRFRGTRDDILKRVEVYVPYLPEGAAVLDLGCGRGETLRALADRGFEPRGVDASAEMVRQCREQGLAAEEGDLFVGLESCAEGTLGGIIALHVIEHLPAESVDRLVRLARRALTPGGVLILETPNPLSLVVAARNFWIDPTHLRPVHPETLRLTYELAGFDPVERIDLRPFEGDDPLPEIALDDLPETARELAHRVNLLRDRLNELLFGYQDYGIVGTRPEGDPPAAGIPAGGS